jgi:hypothetical protein
MEWVFVWRVTLERAKPKVVEFDDVAEKKEILYERDK